MRAGIASELRETLFENLPVSINGRSVEGVGLRAKLDRFMQGVLRWRERQHLNNSLWLYHMVEGEAGLRRSLVHNIYANDNFFAEMPVDNSFHLRVDPEVERHFCWETPTPLEIADHAAPSVFHGTTYDLPAIAGTEDGRIAVLQLTDRFSGGAEPALQNQALPIDAIWMGIKEDSGCGVDEWSPLIELENGRVELTTISAIVADPLASGGQAFRFTHAGCNGESGYLSVTLRQAFGAVNFEQWRGEYIVLLRARTLNETTAWDVRVRGGWRERAGKKNVGDRVTIRNTNYAWYPMGVASIPGDSARVAASNTLLDDIGSYQLEIVAEEEQAFAAVNSIFFDALYLIPYEHHSVLEIADATTPPIYANGVDNLLRFFTHENDTTGYRYYDGGDVIGGWSLTQNNFYMPTRASRFVMAANLRDYTLDVQNAPCEPRDFTQSIVDSRLITELDWETQLNFSVFNRWLSYRDA
jgi:hypothetical protein